MIGVVPTMPASRVPASSWQAATNAAAISGKIQAQRLCACAISQDPFVDLWKLSMADPSAAT
jgi:hypothetical protein